MPIHIRWVALLHDIGRVYTQKRVDNSKYISFGDFEGVSCYIAIDILQKAKVNKSDIEKILKIISHHYIMINHIKHNRPNIDELQNIFEYEEDILYDLSLYIRCDLRGRIIDDSRVHQYNYNKIENIYKDFANYNKKEKSVVEKKYTMYILVGPPNAGKSSFVTSYKKPAIIVSRDRCIEKIGEKYNKNSYDEAYAYMKKDENIKNEVDRLDNSIKEMAKESKTKDIIIDNPNLKSKRRRDWINQKKDTHNIIIILFLTPYDKLITRSKDRSKKDNKTVSQREIINKLKTFNYPLKNEGFDKIISFL
jgi:predicted kinase